MKLFVTGATGVLGRPAVPLLVQAGHEVRAVARNAAAEQRLRDAGAEPVAVDLFDRDAVVEAVTGSDAILHLATHIPPMTRAARAGAWALNNRLRTEATANLVAGARATGATRFVKESITFTYEDHGDQWIDESSPTQAPDLMNATLEGERIALDFAGDRPTPGGRTAVVLRFGAFYGGVGNRATDEWLKLARLRQSPVAGAPDSYVSPIHVDDAASAVVAALDVPTGIYNVVDDTPLTRREAVDAFAAAFGVKRPHITPPWLFRRIAGPAGAMLVASQRVSNRRFREASGWAPAHPDMREGWRAVAAQRGEVRSRG